VRLRYRPLTLLWALLSLVGCSPAPAPTPTPTDRCVVVSNEYRGCYSNSSSKLVLRPVGDTYASDALVVPRSVIEAAREAVYASRTASRDVLVELGLDSTYLEAAPAKIAAALFPHSSHESSHARRTTGEEWTALISASATREELVRRLESHVVGDRLPLSTELSSQQFEVALLRGLSSQKMELTLPGEPLITVTHESTSPFYLPWHVVAGDAEWTTSDVRLTRALAPLIWTENSFDEVVTDWRERVLSDVSIWRGLDDHAESVLSRRLYSAMRGFAEAAVEWRVENVTCGFLAGFDGETLFLDLRAQRARSVDAVRWYVPLVDNRPANDWNELLKLADEAERAAAARPWLVKWKEAASVHSLELQAIGMRPNALTDLDEFVLRPWRQAGLPGSPEFELLLRTDRQAQATVYLAGNNRSGLVLESSLYGEQGELVIEHSFLQRETSYFDADGKAHALR